MILRQAGTWDVGPGTLCCSACTWTHVSSSNKMQRNHRGLKTLCTVGTNIDERQKKSQKSQLTFLKSQEQRQSPEHAPRAALNTPKGAGRPPKTAPASPWTHPTLPAARKQLGPRPHPQKRVVCSCLPGLQRGPHKALPGFLLWLLLNSYWLRSPRTVVSNTSITRTRTSKTVFASDTSRLYSGLRPAPDAHHDSPGGTSG